MKLSIIVPVYNVEDYISQCLESCLHQDVLSSDFEIIVVNDGSPDGSINIIREYERAYNNIIVINKENGGLSSARNAGLQVAKGDYVWFVDSDDWIKENCLGDIIQKVSSNPDIVVLNAYLKKGNEEKIVIRNLSPERCYSGEEVYSKGYIFPFSGAPFYIFNRRFLDNNNLRFELGIYFEDLVFAPEMLSISETCVVEHTPLYFYRIRANSITTSSPASEKKLLDMLTVMDLQFSWKQTYPKCNQKIMADSICKTANELFRRYILKLQKQERRRWYKELKSKRYWLHCVRQSRRFKNYIYYIVFQLFGLARF